MLFLDFMNYENRLIVISTDFIDYPIRMYQSDLIMNDSTYNQLNSSDPHPLVPLSFFNLIRIQYSRYIFCNDLFIVLILLE